MLKCQRHIWTQSENHHIFWNICIFGYLVKYSLGTIMKIVEQKSNFSWPWYFCDSSAISQFWLLSKRWSKLLQTQLTDKFLLNVTTFWQNFSVESDYWWLHVSTCISFTWPIWHDKWGSAMVFLPTYYIRRIGQNLRNSLFGVHNRTTKSRSER